MIPRFSPDYRSSDWKTLLAPARTTALDTLCAGFVERTGHRAALPFRYGRSGIYYLLKALGAEKKKVVLPAYTCVVVAHAVTLSGNIPVFLDSAPGSYQPGPMDYLAAIDSETCVIMPTHIFGVPEETSELYAQVKRRHPGIFVLQDCAHGFFCQDATGRPAAYYGDGAIFGMNISKLVNTVKGGMLTLRDRSLADEIGRLHRLDGVSANALSQAMRSRAYAWLASLAFTRLGYEAVDFLIRHTNSLSSETDYYHPDRIDLPRDFCGFLLPFEAEVGLRSLAHYDDRVAKRREIARFYQFGLQGTVGIEVPREMPGASWSHFPVLVEPGRRDEIRRALRAAGRAEIGVIVDYSIPDLPTYSGHASCPRASALAARVLNLPLTYGEGLWPRTEWRSAAARIVQTLIATQQERLIPWKEVPQNA